MIQTLENGVVQVTSENNKSYIEMCPEYIEDMEAMWGIKPDDMFQKLFENHKDIVKDGKWGVKMSPELKNDKLISLTIVLKAMED